MSASIKSWLMLAGLAIAVGGLVMANQYFNGRPTPRAEITPTTPTSEIRPPSPSRTHFPTILRAKPVTEAEPTASPRYAPRDPSSPGESPYYIVDEGQFYPPGQFVPSGPPATAVPSDTDTTNGESTSSDSRWTEPPSTDNGTSETGATQTGTSENGASQTGATGDVSPASFDVPDALPIATPDPSTADTEAERPAAQPVTYVTKAGDSFWNISKLRYGGEGRFFKALYYHNRYRILRPDQIPAGIEIETPPLAELQQLYPDLCTTGQRR